MAVVFLHSYYKPFAGDPASVTSWIQEFVCQSFTRFAVPYFLVVAALLLFKDYDERNSMTAWWVSKIRSRFFSLIVPYVIWISFALLWNAKFGFVVPKEYELFRVRWWAESYGLICQPRAAYHLWFVRTLYLAVLVGPAIGWIIRRFGCLLPIAGYVLTLTDYVSFDYGQCICYFSVGAWIALHNEKAGIVRRFLQTRLQLPIVGAVCWGIVCVVACYATMTTGRHLIVLWRATIPLALVFYWFIVGSIRFPDSIMVLTGTSFFLYCSHGLFWSVAEHVAILFEKVYGGSFAYWLIRPCVLVIALGLFAILLNQALPKTMAVIQGGRGVRR